jgi:branched-chain amino acid aminotransferase
MAETYESALQEWPSFARIPIDEVLPAARPKGQKLARFVWWDGDLKGAGTIGVHHYANALHYGTAVFEGIRVYPAADGRPCVFRLRDHIERLIGSASLYGMSLPYSADDLVEAALQVTRRNGIDNGYLRPLAYFGYGPIDLKPKLQCPVNVFVAARELGSFLGENALRNGVRVTVSSWRKFHHTMLPTMAKASGHYANSVLAAHEALDRGFDDALLLNHDGTVASATGENIFFVRQGRLFTNDEMSSIVPGITRDCILKLARSQNIPTEVRSFTREELLRADEVFLTGTAAEVTPVCEIDGVRFKTGQGTYSALFRNLYLRAATGKEAAFREWITLV